MAIHVISFDLWKTLIRANPDYGPYRASVVSPIFGWTGDIDPLKHAFSQAAKELDKLTDTSGVQYDLSHRAQRVCEILGLPVLTDPQMEELYETIHTAQLEFPPTLMEIDLPQTLAQLREAGFRLAVTSNTGNAPGATLRAVLEHRGILQYINYELWSDELAMAKPSLAIFNHLVEISQTPAHSILHIGDNRLTDFDGSRNAGFHALQYMPSASSPSSEILVRHSELFKHQLLGDSSQ
jgi:putative hydrolase of the HAD superfamily